MRFAFRVDSSPKIGMGHLMRCLTLADGFKKRGCESYFICRDFLGNGSKFLIDSGYQIELLSVEGIELDDTWLGVPHQQDANETIEILSQNPVDWLIVDHYDIEQQWETSVRSKLPNIKTMVIDDLVNRSHICDVLLDQTYGRMDHEYKTLVSQDTKLCLGTDFALLRARFKELREKNIEPGKPNNPKCHILVTLGGGDSFQPIQVIGKALNEVAGDHEFSVTVIIGNTPQELLGDYKRLSHDMEFVSFSNNIAAEMAKADFVIGAGGGTSWERCCMGLPTIVLTIADNQIEIAKILNENQAGISVQTNVDEIASAVKTLLNDQTLRQNMSKNAANLCDGNGVARVIKQIVASSLVFETSTLSDAQFIYDARYADGASQFYRSRDVPSFEDHMKWMENAVNQENRILACVSLGGETIAHVRIDKDINQVDSGEIGICLAKEWRGKGVGQAVLSAANQYFANMGITKISAEVHKNNNASSNVFVEAGYVYLSADSDGFMRYLWQA